MSIITNPAWVRMYNFFEPCGPVISGSGVYGAQSLPAGASAGTNGQVDIYSIHILLILTLHIQINMELNDFQWKQESQARLSTNEIG